jgi:transposase
MQGGIAMMGKRQTREAKLFYTDVNIEERMPTNHPFRKIACAVDFSFVRKEVAPLYGVNGHESLDPALILKLYFLYFYENIRSERELMRQLPLRIDWLWFCELDLDSEIPNHSVLSKARKLWGEATFMKFFDHVLERCQDAGLVAGQTLHADSTLLKANASLEGRVSRKLWEQLEASSDPEDSPPPSAGAPSAPSAATTTTTTTTSKPVKLNDRLVSPVDPDAATSTRKKGGTMLGYRDHRLVDDQYGVVVSTIATSADVDDGSMLCVLLDEASQRSVDPCEVVGDSMYGTVENYRQLHEKGIKAYLKKRRGKDSPKVSWLKLLPEGCTEDRALYLLGRRKSRAEGSFAEAHVRMDHRHCRWRRLNRVQIQCSMVSSVQNIKKLIRYSRRRGSTLALAMDSRRRLTVFFYPATIRTRRFTVMNRRR